MRSLFAASILPLLVLVSCFGKESEDDDDEPGEGDLFNPGVVEDSAGPEEVEDDDDQPSDDDDDDDDDIDSGWGWDSGDWGWDSGDWDWDSGWGDTGGEPPDPLVSYDWGSSALSLEVDGGPGRSYELGLAQTGDCTDCWTGEDCAYGYLTSAGERYLYCHAIDEGRELRLSYGGDPLDLRPGTTGLSLDDAAYTTFILWTTDYSTCWSWGHDTSYYASEGCTDLVSL